MTLYEFRCRDCGCKRDMLMHPGEVGETAERYCPYCNDTTTWQRWYSFGTGSGSSGEPPRKP